jgi:hypothetical protein
MRKVAFYACVAALLAAFAPLKADTIPIPIDEEFAVSQVLYTTSSLWADLDFFAEDLGFDPLAVFHYDGSFHLFTAPGADPLGDFSGTLAGTYSGDAIEILFDGVMQTTTSREITVSSSQTDNKGKENGTTDSGTVTVEDDGTATVNIKILHGIDRKDVTGSGLSYKKDTIKMTMMVGGDVQANDKKALFSYTYHQDTKDFSSSITYNSSGRVEELPPTFPDRRDFRLTFDAVPVPEPGTLGPVLLSTWRRTRLEHTQPGSRQEESTKNLGRDRFSVGSRDVRTYPARSQLQMTAPRAREARALHSDFSLWS